jgi:hypothetical protein
MTLREKRDKEMEVKRGWTASAFKLKVHGIYAVFDCRMQHTHNAWRRQLKSTAASVPAHRFWERAISPFPLALEHPRATML